ncbi:MAG: hypothetical protein AUG51_03060 [Acidobacteria bacterium 13_1_20CM_3_53_8]|nr:MAG: hypothetical protein AUG51_03060 [Acidobacteria bacterium 13_1_20CM_3_53_8]
MAKIKAGGDALMIEPTNLASYVPTATFLTHAIKATTSFDIEALLAQLPITPEDEYIYDEENPDLGWQRGKFHWMPVGRERGNAGRIKQANQPVNPIAERAINGMEAIIEMARQRELLADASALAPPTPRGAVERYFNLPPLDQLPKLDDSEVSKGVRAKARELAKQLRVRLIFDKTAREFTVAIEDDGIGQAPVSIHRTLLSLGLTTKADKFYLIGVFGQGGSSAYAVSKYSWVTSRRAADLLNGEADGVGWTVIKHVFPRGRRDDYFAYLAAAPDGRVPFASEADADAANIRHGTRFVHIGYDFGRGGSAITRQLYTALTVAELQPPRCSIKRSRRSLSEYESRNDNE